MYVFTARCVNTAATLYVYLFLHITTPTNISVTNTWSFASTSMYVFMAYCVNTAATLYVYIFLHITTPTNISKTRNCAVNQRIVLAFL